MVENRTRRLGEKGQEIGENRVRMYGKEGSGGWGEQDQDVGENRISRLAKTRSRGWGE